MLKKLLPLMISFLWACNADAHTVISTTQTFTQSLVHPLTGIDHFVVLLAIGIWSTVHYKNNRTHIALLPIIFITGILSGQILALSVYQFSGVELAIAVTMVVTGLTMSLRPNLNKLLLLPFVMVLGTLHGHAHGIEVAGGPIVWIPISGMLLGSAFLLIIGILMGFVAGNLRSTVNRFAGIS